MGECIHGHHRLIRQSFGKMSWWEVEMRGDEMRRSEQELEPLLIWFLGREMEWLVANELLLLTLMHCSTIKKRIRRARMMLVMPWFWFGWQNN